MAAKTARRELDFIISVLEPEQRENGTLAIHCRPSTAVIRERTGEAAPADSKLQRKDRRRIGGAIPAWAGILLGIISAGLCYLTVALAEMARRGYFSVGGELIFSIAVGYIVYRAVGIKKSPV